METYGIVGKGYRGLLTTGLSSAAPTLSTLTVNQTEATRLLGVYTTLQPVDSEY